MSYKGQDQWKEPIRYVNAKPDSSISIQQTNLHSSIKQFHSRVEHSTSSVRVFLLPNMAGMKIWCKGPWKLDLCQ